MGIAGFSSASHSYEQVKFLILGRQYLTLSASNGFYQLIVIVETFSLVLISLDSVYL